MGGNRLESAKPEKNLPPWWSRLEERAIRGHYSKNERRDRIAHRGKRGSMATVTTYKSALGIGKGVRVQSKGTMIAHRRIKGGRVIAREGKHTKACQ